MINPQATETLIKNIKALLALQDRLKYANDNPSPKILAERQKLFQQIAHARKVVKDQIADIESIQATLFR